MNLSFLLQEKIKQAVKDIYGISDADFIVEQPENRSFGDFATNVALVLSKSVHQIPADVAKAISYRLQDVTATFSDGTAIAEVFDKIEVVNPGFINVILSNNWLIKLLNTTLDSETDYGFSNTGDGARVALEHSNVNPNKAAHVGHLRNACIGQFIERIYEKQGFKVEVQYYANNVGVQVATSMMGQEKNKELSPTSYKKFDHYAWDVYADMESKVQASEELQKERLDILKKLEDQGSPESIRQRELADKILVEQLKTFSSLGFDYDVIVYESDILAKKLWEKAFEKLKNNSNVYYSKDGISSGCWLVRLNQEFDGITTNPDTIEKDKIIVRSNGVATYTGKDIAYHMWKYGLLETDFDYKKWQTGTQKKDLWVTASTESENHADVSFSGVDYVFDVIGVEQTYAINVVKEALNFLGYSKQAQNMKHINYGFVFLSRETAKMLGIDVSDGKKFYAMSGRKGWGVKIDDLIEKMDSTLTTTYGQFDDVSVVRNGAIKFMMLKSNTFQDLIFDLNEALDLKGYSGPYIQYACVRAQSILKKAGELKLAIKTPTTIDPKESEILRQMALFAEVATMAGKEFAPNLLCEYLFELAKKFSTFYNDLPILNAESGSQKELRLGICSAFYKIAKEGLWLLGIDVPSKM